MDLIVYFEVMGNRLKRNTPDHETWTLEDIKDGFWVTREHFLCRPSQGHYWIPPAQILLVENRHEVKV